MRLVKAQVQNFKCVEDSGEFKIDETVTCLVGKNESGKTALLTALYGLNPIVDGEGQFDKQRDYPRRFLVDYEDRHPGRDATTIRTWWRLDPAEVKTLEGIIGPGALKYEQGQAGTPEPPQIVVHKGYDNRAYWTIPIDERKTVEHLVGTSGLFDEEKEALGRPATVAALKEKIGAAAEPSPRQSELILRIDREFPEASPCKAAISVLSMPKFMFFSQYQRMQGQISLEAIQKRKADGLPSPDDQVFLALCEMAGATVEKVAAIQQFEDLVSRFEGASNKISGEIFNYWTQNRFLKVQFRLDPAQVGDPAPFNSGKVFRTRIHNQLHEVTVPFDDRSTGFVWFFSFLALFSQVKKNHGANLILLLDEPGLTLHAKAQADLLRYFKERLAPDHQVLYTTHSPFMIPPDNLLSARTVEDVVEHTEGQAPVVHGTKVGTDVLSTDKDTLFPLQGALGYEITQSLFVGEHTLLVEGPSDLLYLRVMSDELRHRGRGGLDPRWTICPAEGIDKIAAFMTLFGGNRLHVAVLADFAAGQKKKVEALRESELLRQGHVLTAETYAGQAEADVEDIIGASIYVDLVNACYDLKGKHLVPVAPDGARVVKHVEAHFRTLPAEVPDPSHFRPSAYLTEHRASFFKKRDGLDDALTRFEKLFTDLNALLKP